MTEDTDVVGPKVSSRQWDVALSFAGEQRLYVERVASDLKARGVRCFYDLDEQRHLWGRHLTEELPAIYAERATVVVIFVSAEYAARDWTRLEWRAALTRAVRERREYVLLARFDDTPLPGLLLDMVAVRLAGRQPEEFAEMIAAKLVELGVIASAAPRGAEAGPPLRGPLPARNPFFTGRGQVLADLHRWLRGDTQPVVAVSALAGMGGVGKTQLAAEYVWRYGDAYRLVWWIGAETAVQATASLTALSDALGLPPAEPTQRQARLWETLAARTDWLLIYDNVTDPNLLATVLPRQLAGGVLVTSRVRLPRLLTIDVDIFDRAESIALLRRHLPNLPAVDGDRIAVALADLPLAIDQAGAYLAETPVSVDAYLRLLADQPQLALAEATPDHPGLAATVETARARVAELRPQAARILDQLAFLAPTPIPLIAANPDGYGLIIGDSEPDALESLRVLVRLALVRRTSVGVQLHRLVAALLQARLDPRQRAAVLNRCMHLLASATPSDPDHPASWPTWATLAPHVQTVTAHLATSDAAPLLEPESFRALVAGCASYLYQSGQLDAARQFAATNLPRWERHLPEDPQTLRLGTALSAALTRLGAYSAARELAERTHASARRVLGAEHPIRLASATILAGCLIGLGQAQAAKDLSEETWTRVRHTLGEDHPDTLASAAILMAAYLGLGEYRVARDLGKRILPDAQRVLGDDQPTTLLAATILASALAELGEYPPARKLAERTLTRRWQTFGVEHPLTLLTATALAAAHAGLGAFRAARELAEDTHLRARRTLGDDHPITIFSTTSLATALAGLGEYQTARKLAGDALARRHRILGPDHAATRHTEKLVRGLNQPEPLH